MTSSPRHWIARAALAAGLCLSGRAEAQQPAFRFEHFSTLDGLTGPTVVAIAQDSIGFMWFGTEGTGLSRYDGYTFTHFQHDPGNAASLPSNEVGKLLAARDGALWVSVPGGLSRFDPQTESFTHYRPPSDSSAMPPSVSVSLFEDDRGLIWIGSEGGVYRFDPKSGRFGWYPLGDGQYGVEGIGQDRDGFLWVGTFGGGLFRLDPETGAYTHYRHDPADSRSLGSDVVMAVLVDRRGTLWVGSEGWLNRFDPATGSFTRYAPDLPGHRHMRFFAGAHLVEDRAGALWIGNIVSPSPHGSEGLMRFDPATETFTRFPYDPSNQHGFIGNRVYAMYGDRSGVLWIGTSSHGLYKLDPTATPLTAYPYDPRDEHGLSNNVAWAVHESGDGVVWIGTERGLNRLNRTTGRITHYRHDPHDPNSLSHDLVKAITEDRSGALWVGTYGGGLNRLDPRTGTFTRYRHDPDDPSSLSSDVVEDLLEDAEGVLWVTTYRGGFDRFDPATGAFTRQGFGLSDAGDFLHDVKAIYEDREGTLWAGGYHGPPDGTYAPELLYRLDRKAGRLVEHAVLPGLCVGIAEDARGRLWAATGSGLVLVDKRSGQTTRYGKEHGLPESLLQGLAADRTGALWISTHDRGLFRFNPDDGRVTAYDLTDGLPSLQFLRGAAFAGGSGSLLFGSTNGPAVFRPELVRNDPHVPPVVLTGLRIFNEPVAIGGKSPLKAAISVTRAITLAHDQNDVTFEFAALGYRRTERNRYAYVLEGYDRAWREVGTQRAATYSNLDPGKYLFRVRGSNGDGLWNKQGASVAITVLPPWWATWWFRLLAAVVLLGTGVAAYRYRVDYLLRIERERRRIADDLHDDIGAKMSGIAMLVELVGRSPDLPVPERSVLEEASHSARQLVDDVRDTIWLIDGGHSTLSELIERVGQVAAQMLRGIPHTIELPDAVPEASLGAETRRNVLLIVKEALHNAARHANASRVDVSVSLDREMLVAVVKDDGDGFEIGRAEPGRGLQTMQSRAHELGGTLTVDSAPDCGTAVRLSFRIMQTHY